MSIDVKNLSFSYADRPVLQNIAFTLKEGEFLSILGPNGVGKSTLFKCILGLLSGYTGQVLVDGRDTRNFSVREAARHMAYIPQSSRPVFNFSVSDIVLMGVTGNLSPFRTPGKQEQARCQWALEKMGISHLSHRCYHRLSGGEQQLVLIARALAQNAPILLLDEPTANLDFGNQLLVLEQTRALTAEGYTIIQTTHNPEQSYLFSDRVLALQGGKVLTEGTPAEVITSETMAALYQTDTEVLPLYEDQVRVCIPAWVKRKEEIK